MFLVQMREEELKLPRLTALDACEVRERDWCNVITAHQGHPRAYTWRLQSYAIGEHVLSPPGMESGPGMEGVHVSAVALSKCGTFGLVGLSSGRVDRYNMQSGLHRGQYLR